MRLHSSAQLGHASAHRLLWLDLCLAHSARQVANRRAQTAQVVGGAGAAAHEGGRLQAVGRAVAIEANAFGHHLHVGFALAGIGTMFTFLRTAQTGVDARLVLLVAHGARPVGETWKGLPASRSPLHAQVSKFYDGSEWAGSIQRAEAGGNGKGPRFKADSHRNP